jgi:hypothetical protein
LYCVIVESTVLSSGDDNLAMRASSVSALMDGAAASSARKAIPMNMRLQIRFMLGSFF